MSDLREIPLPLAAADHSKGDPGRAAYAYFKIEFGKVVMYNAKGMPYTDGDGKRYERLLNDHETPEAIALRLAGIINKKLTGDGATGFSGPIRYPKTNYV